MQDDLIGAIYDAPIAAQPWHALTERLRSELDCSGAMFTFSRLNSCDRHRHFIFDSEWDPSESWPLYDSVYRHLDPTCRREMEVGNVYAMDEMVPSPRDGEEERYLRFCHSIGADHALFAYLGEYRGIAGWLSISRDEARGCFDEHGAAALVALLPHLGRAVDIYARIEAERSAAAVHGSALAEIGIGVILLDGAGDIISTNRLADALLDRGDAIERNHDRLKLRGLSASALRRSLAQTREGSRSAHVMAAGDGTDEPLHLLVRPLDDSCGPLGATYAVYLDSPADRRMPSIESVRRRFQLTRAEARMAALLSAGLTIEEAGIAMGITPASARTYCKRVLASTGAARQADLVRMILSSLALLDSAENADFGSR